MQATSNYLRILNWGKRWLGRLRERTINSTHYEPIVYTSTNHYLNSVDFGMNILQLFEPSTDRLYVIDMQTSQTRLEYPTQLRQTVICSHSFNRRNYQELSFTDRRTWNWLRYFLFFLLRGSANNCEVRITILYSSLSSPINSGLYALETPPKIVKIPQIGSQIGLLSIFIAHLAEHCSANAEALGSTPVAGPKFFWQGQEFA